MDIREVIKKAKQAARTPDEVLLPERFEEYLDLLEMRTLAGKEELKEINLRLQQCFASLKEIADRVSLSYGMDPRGLIEFFSNPQNIGMDVKKSIQGIPTFPIEVLPKRDKLSKRKNKNLRV